MSETEFKVGMKVRVRYDRESLCTIMEVVGEDEVAVKWDGQLDDTELDHIYIDELVPYDPEGDKAKALKIQPKIDEAADALERAFKLWREAQNMYSETFQDEAYMGEDDLVDTSKFEKVFESTGWSTSGGRNLYC